MLAMETQHTPHQQGLLKRSTSIWRRLSKSKRERPVISAPSPVVIPVPSPPPISAPVLISRPVVQNNPPPNKLQRRATTSGPRRPPPKNLITTHIVEVPRKRPEPIRTDPRALKTDMQTSSFPDSVRVQTVSWNVFLAPEQVFNLVMGFKPKQMEDKWFIYAEGPDQSGKLKVHFHRSWTGLKIAELFILVDLKGLGAGKIVGIKFNGSEQTNGMDEEEAKYMVSTTCAWVLGVNMEKGFP